MKVIAKYDSDASDFTDRYVTLKKVGDSND